ncbi:hypothetical protein BG58_22775 [Caballeronia jiangsuensis]|nr:hypothetical protein BG58_22775 [Caballeronia jiangsuensis]
MPYEQHSAQSEAILELTAEKTSHGSQMNASGDVATRVSTPEVGIRPDFKFQEYVFTRIATAERLATATLKEVKRQGVGLDERFANHGARIEEGFEGQEARLRELLKSAEDQFLKVVTDDLSALRDASVENQRSIDRISKETAVASQQMDDLYEILNSLAKFQHRLDGIESDLRQGMGSKISELQHGLEASRVSYEQRLAALEEMTHRRLSTIEARMDPLEIRVAILSSTTLFFRAIGRRFKKRIAQLRNRT